MPSTWNVDAQPMAELSVVILSYNTRDYLERCLDCLFAAGAETATALEVIVIDNGSTDGSREMLRSLQDRIVLVENEQNTGFAAANNQGMALATHHTFLLLNSDAFISARTLERAMNLLRNKPSAGIVGVRLDNVDGTVQAEFGRFPSIWDDVMTSVGLDQISRSRPAWHAAPAPVDWIQGACMFVRRELVDAVGGLDTSFFMYSEEVEWCRRAWDGGWEVWYLPDASVIHVGGGSSRDHDLGRRIALYESRLSFRRRLSGRPAATALWFAIVGGLGLRVVSRPIAQRLTGRNIGNQTPRSDWDLLRAILRKPPLAADRTPRIKPV